MKVYIGLYDDRIDCNGNVAFVAEDEDVAESHLDFICQNMNQQYRELYKIKGLSVITKDSPHIKMIRGIQSKTTNHKE